MSFVSTSRPFICSKCQICASEKRGSSIRDPGRLIKWFIKNSVSLIGRGRSERPQSCNTIIIAAAPVRTAAPSDWDSLCARIHFYYQTGSRTPDWVSLIWIFIEFRLCCHYSSARSGFLLLLELGCKKLEMPANNPVTTETRRLLALAG